MLTTRSSVMLLIAAAAIFKGILQPDESVALIGVSILFWLATQWFFVQWAIRGSASLVSQAQRCLDSQEEDYFTLALNQPYEVRVQGKLARAYRGFRISIRDVLPDACRISRGHSRLVVDKRTDRNFEFRYALQPKACGHMELSGLMLLIEDPTGMFRGQRFIPLRQRLTVLPFMIRPKTTVSTLKASNIQQIVGHHRYKKPGISSELLEIRDYQIGDPPRSIAWKPTARTGRLMSCEYESIVPVRATVLGDLSHYQFTGRPGAAVADRVITSVASVSRLLLADRDPVACVLTTENGTMRLPHGHGERQMSRIMHSLLNAAAPDTRLEHLADDDLLRVVFRESYRRFPSCLSNRNSFIPVGRSLLRPFRGKNHRIRCRLAPLLCEVLDYPLGFEYRLIYDRQQMRLACESWVKKFSLATTRIEASIGNSYTHLRDQANSNLCQRLLESRSRAKDIELFVVVGSYPLTSQAAKQLINVMRVCRAAGHRVIHIDAGLPDIYESLEDPVARQFVKTQDRDDDSALAKETRLEMKRLGIRCAAIRDPRLMEIVAMEVDLIRSGKSRGSNAAMASRLDGRYA